MSINTVEYANQLLAENADLKKQVQELKSRLQLVSELSDAAAALHVEAEKQVQALAAEVQSVREQSEEVYAAGYNHGHLNTVDGIAYAPGTEGDFYSNALQVMAEADTPATDAAIHDIRWKARAEGIHFAANRMLAAWESGFVNDTPASAHDISGAVLSAVEFLPNADEGEFKRDYADEVRARIRAGDVSNG